MKFDVDNLTGEQFQSLINWVSVNPDDRKIELTIRGKFLYTLNENERYDTVITTRAWSDKEMASQYGFSHANEIDIAKAKIEQKREEYKKLQAEFEEGV